MKTNTTKRALLLSVISIVVCLTMLVGSTFAWFTDNAATSVNTIQAGTLDVGLEYLNKSGEWENAEGKTLDFIKADGHEDEPILWEPGCTYNLPKIKITNNGNLAFKYKIVLSGIKGDDELNEVIDWTIEGIEPEADHEYHLKPGDEPHEITISGHMQETAGNEYQGKGIYGIAIAVYATQDTVEFDSSTDQYDKDAEYLITDATELAAALSDPNGPENVKLESDISYALPLNPDGSCTTFITIPKDKEKHIDLAGHNLIFDTKGVTKDSNYQVISNKGNLTIENSTETEARIALTHNGKNMEWNALSSIIMTSGGTVDIKDNVTLEHKGGTDMAFCIDIQENNGLTPTVNINGGTLKSEYTAIRMFGGWETAGHPVGEILNVNDGYIYGEARGVWVQHFYGTATVNVFGGKIESPAHAVFADGYQTNADILARESTKININITGGQLISHRSVKVDGEGNTMCVGALSVYRGETDQYADKITLNVKEDCLINNDGGYRYVIFKGYYESVYTL